MVEIAETPDLAEASQLLDQMMAADSRSNPEPAATAPPAAASANPEQRAAQPKDGQDQAQSASTPEIPAAEEPAAETAKTDLQKKDAAANEAAADGKSKFAREKQRRDDSWKALNAEKEQLAAERAKVQAERQAWEAERQSQEQAAAVTPEKYEAFAKQMRLQADHLRAEAERLEEAGKADEADKLREEAHEAEVDIKRATKKAAELRANPQFQAQQNQRTQQRKEWTLRAAQEFPDLAKDNSAFQVAVGRVMQTLPPEMQALPNAIYFASRLAAAETSSAGVSGLKERLSAAEARVKELEALTAPGEAGQPAGLAGEVPFDQRSRDEQWGELQKLAHSVSL